MLGVGGPDPGEPAGLSWGRSGATGRGPMDWTWTCTCPACVEAWPPGRVGMASRAPLTKVGLAAQLLPVADHALAQESLRLWVAGVLHLAPDLGHRVEHGQLSPRGWDRMARWVWASRPALLCLGGLQPPHPLPHLCLLCLWTVQATQRTVESPEGPFPAPLLASKELAAGGEVTKLLRGQHILLPRAAPLGMWLYLSSGGSQGRGTAVICSRGVVRPRLPG